MPLANLGMVGRGRSGSMGLKATCPTGESFGIFGGQLRAGVSCDQIASRRAWLLNHSFGMRVHVNTGTRQLVGEIHLECSFP
eukprot:scaffold2858_cov659-Pavlova_lutheri.AAC.46